MSCQFNFSCFELLPVGWEARVHSHAKHVRLEGPVQKACDFTLANFWKTPKELVKCEYYSMSLKYIISTLFLVIDCLVSTLFWILTSLNKHKIIAQLVYQLGHRLDDQGLIPRKGKRLCSFFITSKPALRFIQPVIHWEPGAISLGLKW
jgi:hypothetical protein